MQKKDLKYYLGLNYPITIEKYTEYDEKEYFAVEIPDLPGCGAGGKTIEEALKNLAAAKRAWIEVSIEKGLDIPEPATEDQFSGKFLLRIPARLHRKLAFNAKKASMSLNQYVRSVIESAIHEDRVIKLLEEQNQHLEKNLKEYLFSLKLSEKRFLPTATGEEIGQGYSERQGATNEKEDKSIYEEA